MTVSLGGVTLSEHLLLEGIESAPGIAYSAQRTIGGRQIVQTMPMDGGRTLSLQGDGHYTLAQITSVKALEAAGSSVALVHHRGTFTVLIVSVEVDPFVDYADPANTDLYAGTITMVEV